MIRGSRWTWSEPEDQRERIIHGAQLVGFEAPGGVPEALRVHDRRLLDEDTRPLVIELDRGAKARSPGCCRCRSDERSAQVQELVGLHHDCIACATLLMPACASRRRQAEDLAADHVKGSPEALAPPSARG